jgi:hypothetical protein
MARSTSGDFFFQSMYKKLPIIFKSSATFLKIKIVAFNKEKTNQNTYFCMLIFFPKSVIFIFAHLNSFSREAIISCAITMIEMVMFFRLVLCSYNRSFYLLISFCNLLQLIYLLHLEAFYLFMQRIFANL